ncbi:MAG: hypothetical protein LCI03_12935 [Actinobacteria bacterium]|nr:hypothetical protein [Actinomycetota bacterium]
MEIDDEAAIPVSGQVDAVRRAVERAGFGARLGGMAGHGQQEDGEEEGEAHGGLRGVREERSGAGKRRKHVLAAREPRRADQS